LPFSQYGGNACADDFNFYKFAFPLAEQCKTYESDNKAMRFSFKRKDQNTPGVFWYVSKREPGGN